MTGLENPPIDPFDPTTNICHCRNLASKRGAHKSITILLVLTLRHGTYKVISWKRRAPDSGFSHSTGFSLVRGRLDGSFATTRCGGTSRQPPTPARLRPLNRCHYTLALTLDCAMSSKSSITRRSARLGRKDVSSKKNLPSPYWKPDSSKNRRG
jgi:hypothetical protein